MQQYLLSKQLQNLTRKRQITNFYSLNTLHKFLTLRLSRFLIYLLGVDEDPSFLRGSPEYALVSKLLEISQSSVIQSNQPLISLLSPILFRFQFLAVEIPSSKLCFCRVLFSESLSASVSFTLPSQTSSGLLILSSLT